MKENILQEMLLIQDPSVYQLYKEMMTIAGYFIAPVFTIAVILEYFGELNFGGVVKKLILISVFMGAFYHIHTKAVELSLEAASVTLKKVSPRNLFVKKWYEVKVKTKQEKSMGIIEKFAIPNLNDLLATAFFLLAKVFIWLLKLIYSTVYHLNYVFSGITAVLYFLGWTKDALKGTIQASIWCILLPFVIVAILSFVGNSFDFMAMNGEFVGSHIDTIIWLFGVTLLLLISPLITYGLIKGDGIHSAGAKMGSMVVSSGMKAAAAVPVVAAMSQTIGANSTVRSIFSAKGLPNSKFKSSGQNISGEKMPKAEPILKSGTTQKESNLVRGVESRSIQESGTRSSMDSTNTTSKQQEKSGRVLDSLQTASFKQVQPSLVNKTASAPYLVPRPSIKSRVPQEEKYSATANIKEWKVPHLANNKANLRTVSPVHRGKNELR